jgi:hypothetical protein
MTYQELLSQPEWLSKRKEIIIRDNIKCSVCCNANLVINSLTVYLLLSGVSAKGSFYYYFGNNGKSINTKRKVFFKDGSSLLSGKLASKYVGYIDPEFENQNLISVIAVRDLDKSELEKWQQISSETTLNDLFHFKDFEKCDFKDYKWQIVPALHVHHTYYQVGLHPWEYPNGSLKTLCWVCHEKLHKEESIPYLDKNGHQIKVLTPCRRCYGAGWLPEYKHVEEGICFRCQGAKFEEFFS